MERGHDGQNRRRNTWYLMDGQGREHPAVIGEERDTRDGHYFYSALPPFSETYPLSCSNMGAVNQWLDAVGSSSHESCHDEWDLQLLCGVHQSS